MTEFNKLQTVKRRFFAMRNGIIADTLRRAGSPYRIIFGLNLPQLTEIATEIGPDADLAIQLRDNVTTRESQMLAPMIYPIEKLTEDKAEQWIDAAQSTEAIDILCHRLLRHMPFAYGLIHKYANSSVELQRYLALRLLWSFVQSRPGEAKLIAKKELDRNSPLTRTVAYQLLDEADFILEEKE